MNEKGVQAIIGHLNAISNNNVSLSNLKSEQIETIGRDSEISLNNLLLNNMDEFEIESETHVDWIVDSVTRPNTMASLSQAKEGSLIGELLRETKLVGTLDEDEDENDSVIPGL